MIRFVFSHNLDPKRLHKEFLLAGAKPRLYSFRPRHNQWSLVIVDPDEAEIIRDILEGFGTTHTTKEVTSRFAR